MSRYRNFYPEYVSVAEKKAHNLRMLEKMQKKESDLEPVVVSGRKIAASFWGKAWCDNVESYQDYENRLPRGRAYLRNGAVIDLKITTGKVTALVAGSFGSPYEVEIIIDRLPPEKWEALKQKCVGKISSLVALAQGKLPPDIIEEFCRRDTGLFPSPKEIRISCTCPDWAGLCKHAAAVMYGIGVRLDEKPKLFFTLRGIREEELISSQVVSALTDGVEAEIGTGDLTDVFGMEFDSIPDEVPPAKAPEKTVPSAKAPIPAGLSAEKKDWPAEDIRALRKRMGLTQAAFGKLCQTSASTICLLEKGSKIASSSLRELLSQLAPETMPVPAETAPGKPSSKPAQKKKPAKKKDWPAEDIRALRKRLGLSQTAFGKLCQTSASTICLLEKGCKIASPPLRELLSQLEAGK